MLQLFLANHCFQVGVRAAYQVEMTTFIFVHLDPEVPRRLVYERQKPGTTNSQIADCQTIGFASREVWITRSQCGVHSEVTRIEITHKKDGACQKVRNSDDPRQRTGAR